MSKPRIFLDMDGVLADCDQFIQEYFGQHYYELGGDYVWQHMTHKVPNIFSLFNPLPDIDKLVQSVLEFESKYGYYIGILTAIPKPTGHLITAAQDKEQWIRKYVHPTFPVHSVLGKELKRQYVFSKYDILIDDHINNINDWTKAGGYAIHHSSKDMNSTLEQLEHIKTLLTEIEHNLD